MCPQSTTPTVPPPTSEEWRPITLYKEWEGVYSVSSLGRIRRETANQGAQAGHILKPNTGPGGFFRVNLSYQGQQRYFPIHRLVAFAFGPTIDPLTFRLTQVNHINGDKADNRPANLKFVRRAPKRAAEQSRTPRRTNRTILHHLLDLQRAGPIGSLPWETAPAAEV
jgi:hypothetical protein